MISKLCFLDVSEHTVHFSRVAVVNLHPTHQRSKAPISPWPVLLLHWVAPLWGRDILLTLFWPWHPTRGWPFHMETCLTPLSLQLLTRQLIYINALLTHPRPGYPVLGLALVWVPSSFHSDTSALLWATTAYHPSGPKHTHIHTLLAQLYLMAFAQIVREGERKGKKTRKRGHNWLWRKRILYYHPLPPMIKTPDPHLYYWLDKKVFSSNSTNTMGFFPVGIFWEREREPGKDFCCSFPMNLVKRDASLLIISRELISLQGNP